MEDTQADREAVLATVARETVQLRAEIDKLSQQVPSLQIAYDNAWDEYIASPEGDPEEKRLDREASHISSRLRGVLDAISARRSKIDKINSPHDIERRATSRERIKKVADKAKSTKVTAKDQNVPAVYLNDAGNFRIGMDARLKSDLIATLVGSPNENALATFAEKEAMRLIQARGWQTFLDRKKAIVTASEAKKAENAKKREESAREKAAAKEAAKAKKESDKAAKAAASGLAKVGAGKGDVTPDPKK